MTERERRCYAVFLMLGAAFVLLLPVISVIVRLRLCPYYYGFRSAVVYPAEIWAKNFEGICNLGGEAAGAALAIVTLRKYRLKYAWPLIGFWPVTAIVRGALHTAEDWRARKHAGIKWLSLKQDALFQNSMLLLNVLLILLAAWGLSRLCKNRPDTVYCLTVSACVLASYALYLLATAQWLSGFVQAYLMLGAPICLCIFLLCLLGTAFCRWAKQASI